MKVNDTFPGDVSPGKLMATSPSKPITMGRSKTEFDNLIIDISNMKIDDLIKSDTCVWSLSNDDSFSVNSVMKHIDEHSIPSLFQCIRWYKMIPKKVNVFTWRMLLDRLPNRLNLSSRGLDIDSISCMVCNGHVESNDHIFFTCDTAVAIWNLVRSWIDLPLSSFLSCEDWTNWFDSWHVSKDKKSRMYSIFAATCWTLWRFRNNITFNSHSMRKCGIFDFIRNVSFSWLKYRVNSVRKHVDEQSIPSFSNAPGEFQALLESDTHTIQLEDVGETKNDKDVEKMVLEDVEEQEDSVAHVVSESPQELLNLGIFVSGNPNLEIQVATLKVQIQDIKKLELNEVNEDGKVVEASQIKDNIQPSDDLIVVENFEWKPDDSIMVKDKFNSKCGNGSLKGHYFDRKFKGSNRLIEDKRVGKALQSFTLMYVLICQGSSVGLADLTSSIKELFATSFTDVSGQWDGNLKSRNKVCTEMETEKSKSLALGSQMGECDQKLEKLGAVHKVFDEIPKKNFGVAHKKFDEASKDVNLKRDDYAESARACISRFVVDYMSELNKLKQVASVKEYYESYIDILNRASIEAKSTVTRTLDGMYSSNVCISNSELKQTEVNNYSLTMHLKQAQQGSSIPGRFHPDVF
uniref:RNA-directed DNA polymerase, eukaryota n=1 Tax=Tanacetum cinerariifolium TaxID=118510 RepID=A0A6L2LB03_TANCI|nr:RNA-directed DNA polymerase, eukaryota [Tanacetum cinerariifolium]